MFIDSCVRAASIVREFGMSDRDDGRSDSLAAHKTLERGRDNLVAQLWVGQCHEATLFVSWLDHERRLPPSDDIIARGRQLNPTQTISKLRSND